MVTVWAAGRIWRPSALRHSLPLPLPRPRGCMSLSKKKDILYHFHSTSPSVHVRGSMSLLCLSYCPYVSLSTSYSAASAEMYLSHIVSPFHLSLCRVPALRLSLYLSLCVRGDVSLSHGPMSLLLRRSLSLCRVRGRCMCVKRDLMCEYMCIFLFFTFPGLAHG